MASTVRYGAPPSTPLKSSLKSALSQRTDSSPLKSALSKRGSTVLGTRQRSGSDDDGEEGARLAKRQKTVVFDESLNTVKQIGLRTLSEVKDHVKRALQRHLTGDDALYDDLIDVFSADQKRRTRSSDALKNQELILYVVALTGYAPLLKRSASLIRMVLQCHWLARDDVFAKAYTQLLASFVSAQGSLMTQVLAMLVACFTETRTWARPLAGYDAPTKAVMMSRLHSTICYMLELFPTCRSILLRQLEVNFPTAEESISVHMVYLDNLFQLRMCTSLSREIIELITLKCCEMDVEMQLDLEDDADDTVQEVLEELQAIKNDDYSFESGSDTDSDYDSVQDGPDDIEVTRNRIQVMDAILDRMFQLYSQELEDVDSPEAAECFDNILYDFIHIILVRHRSRHSQFVIFWAAQKSPEFSSRFIGSLLDIVIGESNRPALVKRVAVSFLAGFVSRAARVTTNDVRAVVRCLLNYIEYFRLKYEQNARGPDPDRYPVFYALFQSLIYIVCFRWRDLIQSPDVSNREDVSALASSDIVWLEGLQTRLASSVHSKLNPLKVCSPPIVNEFARVAHRVHLIYVYPRIETNKSLALSSSAAYALGALRDTGAANATSDRWDPMQADFPFDPYQLPVSRLWLEKEDLYIQWRPQAEGGPPGRREDSSDSGSDEEEEMELDTVDVLMQSVELPSTDSEVGDE